MLATLNLTSYETIATVASSYINEKVLAVEKINGGMTNDNYKLFSKDNIYVLRIPGKGSSLLINRHDEYATIKLLRGKSIDVETIFFDATYGHKVTKFVENTFISYKDDNEKCIVVADLLRKLHHSKFLFKHTSCGIEKIGCYEQIMMKHKIPFEKDYDNIRKKILKIDRLLASVREKNYCPCHNDIVPENILLDKNKKAYLIDWEYSGMNDPLWDLASFALESRLSPEMEQIFLKYYFNEEIEKNICEVIFIYKIYQDILWSHWSAIKSFFGDDYTNYGKMRYNRAMVSIEML
jgi:thiamine kinase-like enzyme